jgi:hypothetical protein
VFTTIEFEVSILHHHYRQALEQGELGSWTMKQRGGEVHTRPFEQHRQHLSIQNKYQQIPLGL